MLYVMMEKELLNGELWGELGPFGDADHYV